MAHTLTENTILSVQTYAVAWACLEDIMRASAGEYALNWGETISPECGNALDFLYERGFIQARPIMPHAPYHFEPTELAREYFTLSYPRGVDREPRNAEYATLQGQWDERPAPELEEPAQLALPLYPEL